jgi:hypothetical protein
VRLLATRGYQHWFPVDDMMFVDNTFDVSTRVEVHGDRIFVGDLRSGRILVLEPGGDTTAQYILPRGQSLTEELKDRIIGDARNNTDPSFRDHVGRAWRPDSIPFAAEFRRDSEGHLWIRPYLSDTRDSTVRWLVYRSDGAYRGSVLLPTGLNVFKITRDRVLGVLRSLQFGSQVVLYQLNRLR